MDFAPTSEQQLLLDTLRRFVDEELLPHEAAVERAGEVSAELAAQIRGKALALGLYAANMPAEVGGGGLDFVTQTLMQQETGRASWSVQAFIGRPSRILMACRDEQVERYLKPCVRGERVDCFALTEPGAGSDAMGITTRARRNGDDYVINGAKHFISHAGHADFVILFAATGENPAGPPRRRKRITAFLIDKDTPGLEVRRGPSCVSYRGYNNHQLFLTNCRVPARQVLGEEGQGFELANQWLAAGRVMMGAHCVGQARRILELATSWSATRRQFGQPIGRFQGVAFKLADMATEIRAAELLTLQAAWKHDQGLMTAADAAIAKLFASEMLGRVADHGVQIFGGMGLMDELPIERMWRDARLERIWEGTSEIQRHIISRDLLRPHERG